MTRPPVVTDIDRKWALDQCPDWARRGCIEDEADITDEGGWLDGPQREHQLDKPNWDLFVIEQIERFEEYFAHDRKDPASWSKLWRFSWWPKANPEKRFPKMAPKRLHPFFKKGSPEFARALKVASAAERAMWIRFGVAQFTPDDPRLEAVRSPPTADRKMLAAGSDA